MSILKVLHSADQHFSNKADKLAEVINTTASLLERAKTERPDVAVLAGDLVDEHDGPIRIDSESARAAIHFVTELGHICPVVIVRGTRSHDRETPYLFRHIRTTYPVHVSTEIELVAMLDDNSFVPLADGTQMDDCKAVFTLIPSPDKANLLAVFGSESISSCTIGAKETLGDALAYLGDVNFQIPENIPRILVAHGMITGAEYSSGSTATGEDFEYSVADLNTTNTDVKCFGHIHKFQTFPGNIFYSGSTGRLNMGETETKGFLLHSLEGQNLLESIFIETPARRFVLYDVPWSEEGVQNILFQAAECEAECLGADVRFRYTIPEENRHQINREELTARFLTAGARLVKIEPTMIPMVRQRAAGISRLETLGEKIVKWGETTGITIPDRVLSIASTIEGRSVEELIEDARKAIAARVAGETSTKSVEVELPADIDRRGQESAVIAADLYHQEADQFDLFG